MSLRAASVAKTKEGSRSSVPPPRHYGRPATGLRLIFVAMPYRALMFVRELPWWQKLIVATVLLLAGGSAGYLIFSHQKQERIRAEVAEEWKAFEQAALFGGDSKSIVAHLDRIDQIEPGNPLVRRRRESLDSKNADTHDQVMVVYWMNRLISENRFAEAVPIAQKRLESVPDDWEANCVMAFQALAENNRAKALAHLKAMPSPLSQRYPVTLIGLAHGMALCKALNADDSAMRMYRALKVAPVIKNPTLATFDVRVQMAYLKTYVESLEDVDNFPELCGHWAGAMRVAQNILDDPEVTPDVLVQLGNAQESQLAILPALVRKQLMKAEKADPYRDEITARIDEIWKKVLELAPQRAEGYLGAAKSDLRKNRVAAALAQLARGREVCNDKTQLLLWQADLVRQAYEPSEALRQMERLAKENPNQAAIYPLLAEAAKRAGRMDKAIDVCRQVREVGIEHSWADKLEAEILLNQEKVGDALALLATYKNSMEKDPQIAKLFVQATCLGNDKQKVRSLLDDLAAKVAGPALIVPALKEALAAGFADDVAAVSGKLAKRFLDYDHDLLTVVGRSHRAAAEPKNPDADWDPELLRTAVLAFDRVHREDPKDLVAADSLAWLQVKAMRIPDAADQTAETLRDADRRGILPESMLNTLGAISLARGRYDEARRLLVRSVSASPNASKYVHLALAYYYLNDPSEARQTIGKAASLPRSPLVSQELKEVLDLLDGKKL